MSVLNIVSLVCFAVCLVSFFYFRWYIKKRTSFSGLEERQSELAQLIAEIDRITDRDSQLVEDRVNKLKELLHDVDARIALYEKDLENLTQIEEKMKSAEGAKKETLYTSLGRGIRAALTEPQESPRPVLFDSAIALFDREPENLKDEQKPLLASGAAAPDVTVVPASASDTVAAAAAAAAAQQAPTKMQIRSLIDALAAEGIQPEDIANRLNISAAEVNLAMNLRGKNTKRRKN